ncbi:DMT family transporter [Bartonella sp. HY038]|uniref:DMT family transporter n=1 Tax=Bartonella sp. HY038 TaxID=2759660 RepID=UPI0015F83906|nr:DMT family transporter [Bartonella sp. HY038]
MRKQALLAFVFIAIIWGTNFIFVKWSAEYLNSQQIVFMRCVFGFIPVFIFALITRSIKLHHIFYLHHFLVMSFLATSLYYYAYAAGTALLPSSMAGLLSGAIPIFTFICAFLFLKAEKITALKCLGVFFGFIGVVLIAQPWSLKGEVDLKGVFLMVLGSLSVGVSFVYAKKYLSPLNLPASALTTYQIGLASIFLYFITDMNNIGIVWAYPKVWLSLVLGLGLLGTGFAYISYYYIVAKLGAVAAASVTYFPPIIALFIGVFLAGEKISILAYFALVFILLGVALLQFKPKNMGGSNI